MYVHNKCPVLECVRREFISDSLEQGLQMIVNHQMCTGYQTQVLSKSNECSCWTKPSFKLFCLIWKMILFLTVSYLYRVNCTVVRGYYKLIPFSSPLSLFFQDYTCTLTSLCILLLGSRIEVRGAMCSLLEVSHIDIWCHTVTLSILRLPKFFQPLFTNILWEMEGWEMSNLWWNTC